MEYEFITRESRYYPHKLLLIKNPPERLYFIGDIRLANELPCVAVVGARKGSSYGRSVAARIGGRLAENGVVTVSGMAAGIDSCAHQGALAADGKTIAVLGTGIDICFPPQNKSLKRQIEEKGLVLSEFPPGTHGSRFSFPLRNRIISGLSLATVVVEAGVKSGSLITAEIAAEQGRAVYAVPGNITSALSLGTNKLLRDGAIALSTADDVLTDMGLIKTKIEQRNTRLSGAEEKIVALLLQNGENSIDELAFETEMPSQKICEIVTILELKGIVSSSMGKIFIANR